MSTVRRFNRHQIVQHAVLLVSFVVLSVTGVLMLYRSSTWAVDLISRLGGYQVVRSVHMWMAWWMIGIGVYHVLWALYERPTTMLPSRSDFRHFWLDLQYTFGSAEEPADYEKFNYTQKFEYWAAFWGFVIMIVTGLVMAYPGAVSLPTDWQAAARVAHAHEAILAILFIVVYHMYASHLRRRVFPFNTVIFTGRMDEETAGAEHSRWVRQRDTKEDE